MVFREIRDASYGLPNPVYAKMTKTFGAKADTIPVTIFLPELEPEAVLAGEGFPLLPEDITIAEVAADRHQRAMKPG